MNRRALITLVGGLLLVLPLSGQAVRVGTPPSAGFSAERLARIRPAMQRMVDAKEVAGAETLIAHKGVVVHHDAVGSAGRGAPLTRGTLYRLASMTKPVTSVAIMMLVEDGRILLSDPLSRFIPAFRDMQVLAAGSAGTTLVRAKREITIEDLLTHRAGLVYGFVDRGPVGEMYRKAGVCDGTCPPPTTLAENVERIARQPLKFHPGAAYEYSVAIDVLGRVVEVVSGMPLEQFFQARIFRPLGMADTSFAPSPAHTGRISALFTAKDGAVAGEAPPSGNGRVSRNPGYYSGGSGLIGTGTDYFKFAQMLLNGGELNGVRILGRSTVALMMTSHTGDLGAGAVEPGFGFGYGGAVRESVGGSARPGSEGTFFWSGIYGTAFWIDPREQLVGIFLSQLSPRNTRVPAVFQAMAYAALE